MSGHNQAWSRVAELFNYPTANSFLLEGIPRTVNAFHPCDAPNVAKGQHLS